MVSKHIKERQLSTCMVSAVNTAGKTALAFKKVLAFSTYCFVVIQDLTFEEQ